MKKVCLLAMVAIVSGCTSSNTIQTSADTAIIQTRAAPVCGGIGAAKVAQKQAAVETIKRGYDRYIIFDAASANSVRTTQMPGTYNTYGTVYGNTINATTTYTPGPMIVSGNHKQSFAIKMFRDGDPGAERALSARQLLGPEWAKIVKEGPVGTCF